MWVALCRRCANYSSSHLGVTETTENSAGFQSHASPVPDVLVITQCLLHCQLPPSIFQYWPPKSPLHSERQGLLQSLFIDEETEILIVEWPMGHGHPAAVCSAIWESRGSAFRVHDGIDWFVSSWILAVLSKALAEAGPCLQPTSVPTLILLSPVFAFLTHLPSPASVFFSPSHISVWETAW